MELALHLGMTADRLEREMTHRELRQWVRYVRNKPLPFRRAEAYAAQIALKIVHIMGGNADATLDDLMIDFGPPREEAGAPDPEATKAAFGFSPRKKKTT
jgi:hypothetical protein